MNRFTKIALAGALLIAPTSAFAGYDGDGDQGAFFEGRAPTYQSRAGFVSYSAKLKGNGDQGAQFEHRRPRSSDTVSIVKGSFQDKSSLSRAERRFRSLSPNRREN